MDYYERGLFNMIAGSRADNTSVSNPQVTYFQPLGPGTVRSYGNTGTCCGGTGMENHLKHQETVYFHSADHTELWVNLFIPSTLNWIERDWSPGDTIDIDFPFPIRIERAIDRPDTQTVMYGPLAYPVLGTPPAGQGGYQQLTLYKFLKRDGDYGRAAVTKGSGGNLVAGGLTLRPQYVGDTQAESMYFRRIEPEIVFGSIATGVANVKRDDNLPNYDVPVTGITSPGDDGLTFLDIVWDQAPFANHGAFVSAVTATANAFAGAGTLTNAQRATVIAAAASAEQELRP
jgi:hypothetical protein